MSGSSVKSQLKSGSDSMQNSTAFPAQNKGKKRERADQAFDSLKRERSSRTDGVEFVGHSRFENSLKAEVTKITDKGGLVDVDCVKNLVQLMGQENGDRKMDLTGRYVLTGVIAATDDMDCLSEFVQLKGLLVLDEWLQDVHKGKADDVSRFRDTEKSIEDFLLILLQALDKLPVNINALQMCHIGKSVNHLRTHKNGEIQKKARTLVDTWKKGVVAEMVGGDAKHGPAQPVVAWPGRSRHAEPSHVGNRQQIPSTETALRSSVLQPCRSSSMKSLQVDGAKSASAGPRISTSPAANPLNGQNRGSNASDYPQALSKDDESSCSSISGSTSGRDGTSQNRRPLNSFPGTSSGVQKESVSTRSCALKNSSEKQLQFSAACENPSSEGILPDPMAAHQEDHCIQKHEEFDADGKERNDVCESNMNATDENTESWESNDLKDLAGTSDEGSESPAGVGRLRRIDDLGNLTGAEEKRESVKLPETSQFITPLNAPPEEAGDDGIRLLASVATGVMPKTEIPSSSGSPFENIRHEGSCLDAAAAADDADGGGVKAEQCGKDATHQENDRVVDFNGSASENRTDIPFGTIPSDVQRQEFGSGGGIQWPELFSAGDAPADNTTTITTVETGKKSGGSGSSTEGNACSCVAADNFIRTGDKMETDTHEGVDRLEASIPEKSVQVPSFFDSVMGVSPDPESLWGDKNKTEQTGRDCDADEAGGVSSRKGAERSHVRRYPSSERDEMEECTSAAVDAETRTEFDLNEGLNADGAKFVESISLVPSLVSGYPLTFSSSYGLPSVTVAAAARGPFVPPLRSKGEPGWKGSAATSAFRPLGTTTAATPERKSRPSPLGIDLNIPDERMFEDVTCQLLTGSKSSVPPHHHRGLSRGLAVDLNSIDETAEFGHYSARDGRGMEAAVPVAAKTSSSSSCCRNDIDLNNGPRFDELSSSAALEQQPLLFGRTQSMSCLKMSSAEMSGYPLPLPALLPDDRGEHGVPLIVPPRMLAAAFPANPLQYPIFPFGTGFSFPQVAPAGYIDPAATGGNFCYPVVGRSIPPPPPPFAKSYGAAAETCSTSSAAVVAAVNPRWSRQGLDLNAGPGGHEAEGKDETSPALVSSRQLAEGASQFLSEEQARMYRATASGTLKRKDAQVLWEGDRFHYGQSPWQ